jgi:hypothetical protein
MSPASQIASLGAVAAVLAAVGTFILLRVRNTPEKLERRRRLYVYQQGRLGDAMITEATDEALYYSYTVRGVQYAASQDLTGLRELLPAELDRLIGPASLKYATNNPANSILICEEWSGLRPRRETPAPPGN